MAKRLTDLQFARLIQARPVFAPVPLALLGHEAAGAIPYPSTAVLCGKGG